MSATRSALTLVPTPIGNLDDITLRAGKVLAEVDAVVAEDTRVTGRLLQHLGLSKPLISFHSNNEHRMVTSRLMFAASYWLTGTVNFHVIGAIGNLFLVGACAWIEDARRRRRHSPSGAAGLRTRRTRTRRRAAARAPRRSWPSSPRRSHRTSGCAHSSSSTPFRRHRRARSCAACCGSGRPGRPRPEGSRLDLPCGYPGASGRLRVTGCQFGDPRFTRCARCLWNADVHRRLACILAGRISEDTQSSCSAARTRHKVGQCSSRPQDEC